MPVLNTNSIWESWPSTGIEYDRSNAGLQTIQTIDDVDAVFLQTLVNRIRFKFKGQIDYYTVPVFHYNENDRIKSTKKLPLFVVQPFHSPNWIDHIEVGEDYVADGNGDFVVQNKPIWKEFTYRVSTLNESWYIHKRISMFLNDQLFPQLNGQRHIVIASTIVDNNEVLNKRDVEVIDESTSEDFDKGTQQYDITFKFRLPILVSPTRIVPGISAGGMNININTIDPSIATLSTDTLTNPSDQVLAPLNQSNQDPPQSNIDGGEFIEIQSPTS